VRRVILVVGAVTLAGVLAVACSRIGDDRFPKLPDATPVDAPELGPDAAGPGDALFPVDARVDAA
jgi:hypothetical protein